MSEATVKLSRNNIMQLYSLMREYPEATDVEVTVSNNSGIGPSVNATVYTANVTTDVDLTDYDSW